MCGEISSELFHFDNDINILSYWYVLFLNTSSLLCDIEFCQNKTVYFWVPIKPVQVLVDLDVVGM